MNGLIHNDLVISILVVALLTAVGRLILGVFSVGVEGAAVFVAAGYLVVYLTTVLWRRLRTPRKPTAVEVPPTEERSAGEEADSGSAVQA